MMNQKDRRFPPEECTATCWDVAAFGPRSLACLSRPRTPSTQATETGFRARLNVIAAPGVTVDGLAAVEVLCFAPGQLAQDDAGAPSLLRMPAAGFSAFFGHRLGAWLR
jgi:hypothetical protein